MKRSLLTILFVSCVISVIGQERIKPGELYPGGSPLWAPRVGVKATVPENWSGLLPRGEEIFLLSSINSFGEIFVMTNESSFEVMKETWIQGVTFGGNVLVKSIGEPTVRNKNILSAELTSTGTTGTKGHIEAKCGPYNVCLLSLMTSDPQNFDKNKKGLQEFMDNLTFVEPSNVNPYLDFDWDEFLRNKQLVTFAYANEGSKETMVTLCGDGTFKANIKKTGMFKEQGLKGKKSGTWSVDGKGPTTKLIFDVAKNGKVEIMVEIKDEKVFANGERYFVSNAEGCK